MMLLYHLLVKYCYVFGLIKHVPSNYWALSVFFCILEQETKKLSSRRGTFMNYKNLLLGAAAGFAAGYAAKQALEQNCGPSPEKVLASVKESVKKDGKIYGSWIVMKPENYQKNDLDYQVFKGGITRYTDGLLEQFDFAADASTGTIIDLTQK